MITKTLKHGLTLAFVMAFLTACSTSGTKKDETPVNQTGSDSSSSSSSSQEVMLFTLTLTSTT
jgi:outer membrane biogenesis lipoprotein LolB